MMDKDLVEHIVQKNLRIMPKLREEEQAYKAALIRMGALALIEAMKDHLCVTDDCPLCGAKWNTI